jgi:hypothetical protein
MLRLTAGLPRTRFIVVEPFCQSQAMPSPSRSRS